MSKRIMLDLKIKKKKFYLQQCNYVEIHTMEVVIILLFGSWKCSQGSKSRFHCLRKNSINNQIYTIEQCSNNKNRLELSEFKSRTVLQANS